RRNGCPPCGSLPEEAVPESRRLVASGAGAVKRAKGSWRRIRRERSVLPFRSRVASPDRLILTFAGEARSLQRILGRNREQVRGRRGRSSLGVAGAHRG